MSVPDRDKLLKLLALLDSDQDAEAVAAARKAAALLRNSGLDWDEVVVLAPQRGWRSWLNAWLGYAREMKRRRRAPRAAEHWRALARLRQEELERRRSAPGATGAAATPIVTGHAL